MSATITFPDDYVDELNIEGENFPIVDTDSRTAIGDLITDVGNINTAIESIENTIESIEGSNVDLNGTNIYGTDSINAFPAAKNILIGSDTFEEYILDRCELRTTTEQISVGPLNAHEYIAYSDNYHYVTAPDGENPLASDYMLLGVIGWTQWHHSIRITSRTCGIYHSLTPTPSTHFRLSFGVENDSDSALTGGTITFTLLWATRRATATRPDARTYVVCPNCNGFDTNCPYWISAENRHMTTIEILEFEWLEWHYYDPNDGNWYELRTGNTDPVEKPWYVSVEDSDYTYESPH